MLMARSAGRVRVSQPAKDWLWSESGGHCQNPECRADLHGFVKRKNIGELAHIIPASTDGPRGEERPELTGSERAQPENIVLLCPTCHSVVDKEPDTYPSEELRQWKVRSQAARAVAHGTPTFNSRTKARRFVERLLGANRVVFDLYGPRDELFDDSRAEQWRRHVSGTIIPNNRDLLRVLQANEGLLTGQEKVTAHIFAVHVQELEERHLRGDWTPGTTRFPSGMVSVLEGEE